jgi:hypothetical protein
MGWTFYVKVSRDTGLSFWDVRYKGGLEDHARAA